MSNIKGIILFLSLLYLTFYIPMTLSFYTPQWMTLNCGWHVRCDTVGRENAEKGIKELSAYFRHQGELDSFWTRKEKLHLEEVRGIFDKMIIVGIATLILLIITYNRKQLSRFALINSIIILSLLIILPFFGTFWRDVFHPLLFDNELWQNDKFDLSYYIMPRVFFKYTVALLIISCFLINFALWIGLRGNRNKV